MSNNLIHIGDLTSRDNGNGESQMKHRLNKVYYIKAKD